MLLEKEVEYLKVQSGRTVAHVDSEQRVRVEQGKRLDASIRDVDRLKDDLRREIDRLSKQNEKHESMLVNGGHGLTYRVDRIEQRQKSNRDTVALFISIALGIFQVVKLFIR